MTTEPTKNPLPWKWSFSLCAAQRVFVVGDAEVGANLVLLDVFGADDDDYLYRVGELGQHAQFGIRLEAGQDAGSVMVVEEFAAEFKI